MLLAMVAQAAEDIDGWTGSTAPNYEIPDDCLNGVVTFEVGPSTTTVCVDVASLFVASNSTTGSLPLKPTTETRALRGRQSNRFLQGENATVPVENVTVPTEGNGTIDTSGNTSSLFMIDNLITSARPGDQFYTRNDPGGRGPTLVIGGAIPCRTVGTL